MAHKMSLTRRMALFLSAGQGLAAVSGEALAADSTKTGAHQEPGYKLRYAAFGGREYAIWKGTRLS